MAPGTDIELDRDKKWILYLEMLNLTDTLELTKIQALANFL